MEPTLLPRAAGYLALIGVVLGNAAGNVLLKLGAMDASPRWLVAGRVPWQTLAGIGCFAFGVIAYAWALKRFELHMAQVLVSVQYVATISLATLLLGESISPLKWLGIALIALGIALCLR